MSTVSVFNTQKCRITIFLEILVHTHNLLIFTVKYENKGSSIFKPLQCYAHICN